MSTVCVGECSAAGRSDVFRACSKGPSFVTEPSFFSRLQLLEATHPNTAGHALSHRPFEVAFMQEEVAMLLNAVSGSWKWKWMQEHKKMDAWAAQTQSPLCGCLQGSPCKTLDDPGAHGDGDTGAMQIG